VTVAGRQLVNLLGFMSKELGYCTKGDGPWCLSNLVETLTWQLCLFSLCHACHLGLEEAKVAVG